MIVVADTSALYAAFDASNAAHPGARAVVEHETLAISPMVLTEIDHLVHRDLGFAAATQVADGLSARMTDGRYKLAELRPADLVAAQEVRSKYDALKLDLADAIGVVIAHRYKSDRIFTLDQRDFRAITPLTPGFDAFRILPADA